MGVRAVFTPWNLSGRPKTVYHLSYEIARKPTRTIFLSQSLLYLNKINQSINQSNWQRCSNPYVYTLLLLTIVCLTQVWQSLFPFFVTKRSSLLSKLGKHLRYSTTCLYSHTFCLSSAKCWFYSLDPIVKFAHCQQYNLACLYCLQQTNLRDRIIGNVHILQQELLSKINIFLCWDKK